MTYSYRHHIIPKHEWKKRFSNLRGVHAPDNVVWLTLEQHIQVHCLLWEMNGSKGDWIAFQRMSDHIGNEETIRLSQSMGGLLRKGKPSSNGHAGHSHSVETKKKLSDHFSKAYRENCPNSRDWAATSPSGEVFCFRNLNEFCRIHNLQQQNMVKVSKGKRNHHRGWICKKEESNYATKLC